MTALTATGLVVGLVIAALLTYCAWWVVTDLQEEAEHRRAEQWRAEEKQRRLEQLRAAERSYWADQEGRP